MLLMCCVHGGVARGGGHDTLCGGVYHIELINLAALLLCSSSSAPVLFTGLQIQQTQAGQPRLPARQPLAPTTRYSPLSPASSAPWSTRLWSRVSPPGLHMQRGSALDVPVSPSIPCHPTINGTSSMDGNIALSPANPAMQGSYNFI